MPEAIRVAKLQVAEDGGIPSSVAGKSRFFQPVSGFKSTNRPGVWSSHVSSTSVYLNELCNALLIQALSIYSFAQSQLRKRAGATTNLAGLAGFAIACVALWSTLSSMHDTRQALALAQWTARKDFLQYCHSVRETSSPHSTTTCHLTGFYQVNYTTVECAKKKKTSLSPPPIFVNTDTPVITVMGCTGISFDIPAPNPSQMPTAGLYGIIKFVDHLPPLFPVA
jgi:hypothetical protein